MANIVNLDRVSKAYGTTGPLFVDVSIGLDDSARLRSGRGRRAERRRQVDAAPAADQGGGAGFRPRYAPP
jgi:hypothetical protein